MSNKDYWTEILSDLHNWSNNQCGPIPHFTYFISESFLWEKLNCSVTLYVGRDFNVIYSDPLLSIGKMGKIENVASDFKYISISFHKNDISKPMGLPHFDWVKNYYSSKTPIQKSINQPMFNQIFDHLERSAHLVTFL